MGSNSIKCTSCDAQIHKKCSGIAGKLQSVVDYRCQRCIGMTPVSPEVLKQISLGMVSTWDVLKTSVT